MLKLAITSIASLVALPAAGAQSPPKTLFESFRECRGLTIVDPDGKKAAYVRNLLIDARTGTIEHLLVDVLPLRSTPGDRKLLPWGSVVWTGKGVATTLTRARLLREPTFDPKRLNRMPHVVTASHVTESRLDGREGSFGTIDDIVLEPAARRVAFAGVRELRSRKRCFVPWSVLSLTKKRGKQSSVTVAMPLRELRRTPGLTGDEVANIEDPRYRRRVRAHFAGLGRMITF